MAKEANQVFAGLQRLQGGDGKPPQAAAANQLQQSRQAIMTEPTADQRGELMQCLRERFKAGDLQSTLEKTTVDLPKEICARLAERMNEGSLKAALAKVFGQKGVLLDKQGRWISFKEPWEFPLNNAVNSIAFSSDNKRIVTGCSDKKVRILDLERDFQEVLPPGEAKEDRAPNAKARGKMQETTLEGKVASVVFCHSEQKIIAAAGKKLVLLDARTLQTIEDIEFEGTVISLALSADGQTIVTGNTDRHLRAVTLRPNRVDRRYMVLKKEVKIGKDDWLRSVACSPDDESILVASDDHHVRLLRADSFTPRQELEHGGSVTCVAFQPAHWSAAPLGAPRAAQAPTLRTSTTHQRILASEKLSRSSRCVVTASKDRKVRLLEAETLAMRQEFVHDGAVKCVAFSPDGTLIATGAKDGKLRLLDAQTLSLREELDNKSEEVTSCAFSPDSTTILWGVELKHGLGGQLRSVRVKTLPGIQEMMTAPEKEPQQEFQHEGHVQSVAISPDLKFIVTGSTQRLRLLDAGTLQNLQEFDLGVWVNSVAFSSDSKCIITGSSDKKLRLWDIQNEQLRQRWCTQDGEHESYVLSVAFSPNAKEIVTGTSSGRLRKFSANTGRLQECNDGLFQVKNVAFGERVVVNTDHDGKSVDKKVPYLIAITKVGHKKEKKKHFCLNVVETEKLYVMWEYGRDTAGVNCVAFTRDGESLVTGWDDGKVRILKSTSLELQQELDFDGRTKSVALTSIALSPDEKTIIAGSNGTLMLRQMSEKVSDRPTGISLQELHVFPCHHKVTALAWQADSERGAGHGVVAMAFGTLMLRMVPAGLTAWADFQKAAAGQLPWQLLPSFPRSIPSSSSPKADSIRKFFQEGEPDEIGEVVSEVFSERCQPLVQQHVLALLLQTHVGMYKEIRPSQSSRTCSHAANNQEDKLDRSIFNILHMLVSRNQDIRGRGAFTGLKDGLWHHHDIVLKLLCSMGVLSMADRIAMHDEGVKVVTPLGLAIHLSDHLAITDIVDLIIKAVRETDNKDGAAARKWSQPLGLINDDVKALIEEGLHVDLDAFLLRPAFLDLPKIAAVPKSSSQLVVAAAKTRFQFFDNQTDRDCIEFSSSAKDERSIGRTSMEYRVFMLSGYILPLLNGAAKHCPETMLEQSTTLHMVTQLCWEHFASTRSWQHLAVFFLFVICTTIWSFMSDVGMQSVSPWWIAAGLATCTSATVLAEMIRQVWCRRWLSRHVVPVTISEVMVVSMLVSILMNCALTEAVRSTRFLDKNTTGFLLILISLRYLVNEVHQAAVWETMKDAKAERFEQSTDKVQTLLRFHPHIPHVLAHVAQALWDYFAEDPPWNAIDLAVFLNTPLLVIMSMTIGDEYAHTTASFTALVFILQWVRVVACLRCFTEAGPMVTAIWKILVRMRLFLLILLLLLVGPVLSWTMLATRFPDSHYLQEEDTTVCEPSADDATVLECGSGPQYFGTFLARLWASFTLMYRLGLLGDFAGDAFALADHSGFNEDEPTLETAGIAWIVFLFVSIFYLIVLLNMLIAIMSDAYAEVLGKIEPVTLRAKAKMCRETRDELKWWWTFPDVRLWNQPHKWTCNPGHRDLFGFDEEDYLWVRFPQSEAANAARGNLGLRTDSKLDSKVTDMQKEISEVEGQMRKVTETLQKGVPSHIGVPTQAGGQAAAPGDMVEAVDEETKKLQSELGSVKTQIEHVKADMQKMAREMKGVQTAVQTDIADLKAAILGKMDTCASDTSRRYVPLESSGEAKIAKARRASVTQAASVKKKITRRQSQTRLAAAPDTDPQASGQQFDQSAFESSNHQGAARHDVDCGRGVPQAIQQALPPAPRTSTLSASTTSSMFAD
eukprot:TRINITY_DN80800_c0_g1_i1.p1 TRINITY_DN80800_c0_g1~~TRINITY_DN80800_c0_g1_i1.p1  ORF type:complete len:1848 (+),score=319.03 TRINITY_DN80800_c0_g1_i1:125-5668(+)